MIRTLSPEEADEKTRHPAKLFLNVPWEGLFEDEDGLDPVTLEALRRYREKHREYTESAEADDLAREVQTIYQEFESARERLEEKAKAYVKKEEQEFMQLVGLR
jgi:hypothetical protein